MYYSKVLIKYLSFQIYNLLFEKQHIHTPCAQPLVEASGGSALLLTGVDGGDGLYLLKC